MNILMRSVWLTSFVSLLCVNTGWGLFSKGEAGTAAAQFLKLGAGARLTAMGDAGTALADDSTAIYWNPAGLNNVTGKGSLTGMHAVWIEDINYDWLSYALPCKNGGGCGAAVQYLSYGDIQKLDNTGTRTGSFSPNDLCVTFSYARHAFGFDLGFGAKYVALTIDGTATAYAVDLGAQRNLMNDRATIGLALQNIGTKIKFIAEENPLPLTAKAGIAFAVSEHWLAAMDLAAPSDSDLIACAGTEYLLQVNNRIGLAVRGGYSTRNTKTGGLNGITGGVGIRYHDLSIDYAYVPYGDLGNTQRLSLSVKF